MSKSQRYAQPLYWTTRQVVQATLFVVAVGAAFYLLFRFSQIIFMQVVAIVLGTAIRPAVDWLNQRGFSRPAGVILIYLGLFSLAESRQSARPGSPITQIR
jgi:predicted PurR-regulated permease PerM